MFKRIYIGLILWIFNISLVHVTSFYRLSAHPSIHPIYINEILSEFKLICSACLFPPIFYHDHHQEILQILAKSSKEFVKLFLILFFLKIIYNSFRNRKRFSTAAARLRDGQLRCMTHIIVSPAESPLFLLIIGNSPFQNFALECLTSKPQDCIISGNRWRCCSHGQQ